MKLYKFLKLKSSADLINLFDLIKILLINLSSLTTLF